MKIDTARIRNAANSDPEFKIAARFWTAALRIEIGVQGYLLEVRDGVIVRFMDASEDDAHSIRIAAPTESWSKFLERVPRPFLHDLGAAVTREGFALEGDLMSFWPYYPAMRRLFDVMREVGPHNSKTMTNAALR